MSVYYSTDNYIPIILSDKQAIDDLSPGDAVIIFTPDSKYKYSSTFLL
jgi:hypothetical protein